MKIILVFFRSAKTFPALFSPKEIIVLCCSKDPPSPAVFAYWKHPIGPPAEHKAPGAQAAQRRSFWGLQPQCLWRSLSPLGLIRGLHKENKGVKEIRENNPVSSSCHQDQTISCMSLFMFWLDSHIITCQTAASNNSDELLTLFKLPLHAFHLWLVATYAVQTLSIQAWGKKGEDMGEGAQ